MRSTSGPESGSQRRSGSALHAAAWPVSRCRREIEVWNGQAGTGRLTFSAPDAKTSCILRYAMDPGELIGIAKHSIECCCEMSIVHSACGQVQ